MVASCVTNVLNAIATRHLAPYLHPISSLPNPDYIYSPAAMQQIRALYELVLEAWRKNKTLRKQQLIEDSVAMDMLSLHWVKSHIKTEVVSKFPTKARLIQGFLRLRDNYEFADQYRAYTEALVAWSAIPRQYFHMYVHLRSACGLNRAEIASQVSDWMLSDGNGTIFIDDVTNMDGNVQKCHLEAQYRLYDVLDRGMAEHARASMHFRGVVPVGKTTTVLYAGCATVKSGAQDTSSGQTARRLDCFVRCLYNSGVTRCVGFVFGDDLWVILHGQLPTVEAMRRLQAECGWETKGQYVRSIEQSDFLASSFVPLKEGGYAMVPLIGRLFAKLFWTHRVVPPRRVRSYVKQIAESFLPVFAGFRFVESWLAWHIGGVDQAWKPEARLNSPAIPQGTPLWQEFVWRRYGLPMPSMFDFNQFHRRQVVLLFHPWANAVMAVDLADPSGRDTF